MRRSLKRRPAARRAPVEAEAEASAEAGPGFDVTHIPATPPVAPRPAPPHLRASIERRAGVDLSDVRVAHNSDTPAAHDADAFARGAEIHLAPGAEATLPHELWHVAQQKQGRVAPTGRSGRLAVNRDAGLEREAEAQGVGAGLSTDAPPPAQAAAPAAVEPVAQMVNAKPRGIRKKRPRAAKRKFDVRRNPPRGSVQTIKLRQKRTRDAARDFDDVTERKLKRATKMGAFRTRPEFNPATYAAYPEGSYGKGRYHYLMGHLSALGSLPNGMLDFDTAPVEIDHSPNDGSQRRGKRKADEASMHRVAVPLPRGWHRRHKTTAGGPRLDTDFVDDQKELVKAGHYHEALQNHLLETLSDEAIHTTGPDKVNQVIGHIHNAVTYAATNIPVSLHAGHKANTPAISAPEAGGVRAALRARVNALKLKPQFGGLNNPF